MWCLFLLFIIIFYSVLLCNGSDTLLAGQSLLSNQTLVSKGGKFELGFFSPSNSTNYYLGIWYKNIPIQTVVWVLNRYGSIPCNNDSQLQLSFDGSLILNCSKQPLEFSILHASEAVILDTGNCVLRNHSGNIIWESFEYPADTWLPGMKLRYSSYWSDGLVSWMSPNDPTWGNYSLALNNSELSIHFNSSEIVWRSVLYNFLSIINSYNLALYSSDDGDYWQYNDDYSESLVVSRIVIDYLGRLMRYRWSEGRQDWIVITSNSNFMSGPNTICKGKYSPECRCLDGFVPRLKQDWSLSNYSSGCVRTRPLECAHNKVRFIKVTVAKLAGYAQYWTAPNELCNLACSRNCTCTAYGYDSGGGVCSWYRGDLSTMESPPNSSSVGVDLYIKTEESTHNAAASRKLVVEIVVPITAALIISCFCFCYMRRRKLKSKVPGETNQNLLLLDFDSNEKKDGEEEESGYELPMFSFGSIAASTNNFSITKKLGQGGFGPVYKGELLNGQFVAVKRLSRRSSQGVEEFKNEMKLIAKLQHKNLVGILGCCNENDEMILVYEYMPNKSLDFFLFEPTRKELLDWKKRVHIISGIAQGLLYLHQYSRLRIVHRDLKASNILLDANMSPKISDFGMARIFGGTDQLQAITKRIVGTYGYMSPEYAMEGLFSVKSDVFAFGVLMLEIISGKKNQGFYGSENLSLLGYTWNLWKNDCADELIDPMLEVLDSCSSIPLRYIQIGLLCVEKNAAERPLICDVVGMLNNEKRAIASPRNPAFTVGRSLAKPTPTQQKIEVCSINGMTVSHLEAR